MTTRLKPAHPFCCKELAKINLQIHEQEIARNNKERPNEHPNPPFEPCYQFLKWATNDGHPIPSGTIFPAASSNWLIAILSYHHRPDAINEDIRLFLPVLDAHSDEAVAFAEVDESVLQTSFAEILEGRWRSGVLECEKCVEDGPDWTMVPRSFELFWFERPKIWQKRNLIARLAGELLKSLPREGSSKKGGWRRLKA